MKTTTKNILIKPLSQVFFISLIFFSRISSYASVIGNTPEEPHITAMTHLSLYDLVINNIHAFSLITFLLATQSIVIFLLQRSRLKHKKLERELQKSEERYKNLIQDIHEAVLIINNNGIVTYSSNSINRHNGSISVCNSLKKGSKDYRN